MKLFKKSKYVNLDEFLNKFLEVLLIRCKTYDEDIKGLEKKLPCYNSNLCITDPGIMSDLYNNHLNEQQLDELNNIFILTLTYFDFGLEDVTKELERLFINPEMLEALKTKVWIPLIIGELSLSRNLDKVRNIR